MKILLIIGTGGFLGSIARYLTTISVHRWFPSSLPWGTFIVNLSGCFLIGIFYGLSERGNLTSGEWKLFLTVGFCGGFTTFSSFVNENLVLIRGSEFLYFALYTGFSVFLGLLATYFGNAIIKFI